MIDRCSFQSSAVCGSVSGIGEEQRRASSGPLTALATCVQCTLSLAARLTSPAPQNTQASPLRPQLTKNGSTHSNYSSLSPSPVLGLFWICGKHTSNYSFLNCSTFNGVLFLSFLFSSSSPVTRSVYLPWFIPHPPVPTTMRPPGKVNSANLILVIKGCRGSQNPFAGSRPTCQPMISTQWKSSDRGWPIYRLERGD